MKKIILFFGFFVFGEMFSQDIAFNKLYGNGDPNNYYLSHYPVAGSDGLAIYWHGGIRLSTSLAVGLQILNNGNVGIGTVDPQAKFDVNFGGEPKTIKFLETTNNVNTMNSMLRFTWYNDTADVGIVRSGSYPIEALAIRFNQNEVARFTPNGNALLQGKFEAKEVKVTLTPTADFVFDEDYKLPELDEVEKHIKEKKHLPEIASAAQMEKEGVNIGEFQIKLLQKIEELTLYTIEQNKQLKKLQDNNDKLMKEMDELKGIKK
ncbi:hypothetical protein [Chryseobacterium lathyri]|uniref:hypothetical protein n=1 Tax=Chryseobacterium lathyri TaxID=395933 RepID=UPI00277EBF88|nr:hypothetical protein [Chryseobacterium lathyri]MDQ0066159.1 hypothetical protein [Chryseobacterium lathyri]